ncbi:putative cell division specific transpeptidase/penicillin-binding protein [Polaribacter irgensii 23-P]|uniref:Putative cell division specific transpeptidase/penicillin-binding protein n=1 Tax=Polaribacter irgensii 23-P TaxID=313594 RepID=A4BVY5_9FLAO|nr:penicillin-binding protein [Polaribacter irgensii]EAR13126.1 putative cell division specific transpeptidase/penicillin-binding protein [Polaribacter irgensii 23-P]
MTFFLLAIIFRVINLQYVQGDTYRKLATELTIRQDTIYANKGNVYAADGNLLATSMSKFNIFMDLVTVDEAIFEKHVKGLSVELSRMLGSSASYYEKTLRRAKNKKRRYFLITRNIGYTDYLKMREFPIFNLGVYKGGFIAKQRTERAHPIGKIAERTIGYDDFRGGAGIEGAFAAYMKGENGLRWEQKIAKNQWKPIADYNEKEPIDGHDIITTIDVNIQDITHHALLSQLEYFDAEHGCAVVMETASGEIKAISNLGRTKKGTYYEKRNYAVWESHEPGSTFKVASLMAALDDQLIDTATVVDTEKGRIYIHGSKVEDSHQGGYGKISAARVLEVSSNVGIVKLIKKQYDHQPEKFIKKIEAYGFTEPIGFEIKGEGIPIVPVPSDKRWNKISLEWMSWGYGISVTPMQILMFYNAIANNGIMVKPRFIKELRRQDATERLFKTVIVNPKIASETALRKVRKVLENVVVRGTASNIYSSNFSMAGKTGTAKKYLPKHIDKNGEKVAAGYSNKRYVASFAGFFPADNPKYSCIVVIHDPKKEKGYYGATVAAPVFKEIAQKIYTTTPLDSEVVSEKARFVEIEKAYFEYEDSLEEYDNSIPNVKGMSGMDAVSLLENIGLKVKISGVGKVQYQSLEKGAELIKGKTITLKLS